LTGWASALRRLESLSASSGALLTPCFTNERGCASALTVEWLLGRAERAAVVSFAGCGGLAALEEVLAALRVYGALPGADLAPLPKLAALYSRLGGAPVSPVKAVIGEAVFYVEAGIHVDGLGKSPDLYEPFPPESVGRERRIVMGKHSSRRSVLAKCAALDLPMTEALAGRLLKRLKEESAKRGASLRDEDFISLYSACRL
jgi:homocitrate synthase NifV